MTGQELRDLMRFLNITSRHLGAALRYDDRAIRRMTNDQLPVPNDIAEWLRAGAQIANRRMALREPTEFTPPRSIA